MIDDIIDRHARAKAKRSAWENLWQDCYDYALPLRSDKGNLSPNRKSERLYDATALDAVDQLAASLLGNLTPIWTQWFGLRPGPQLSEKEAQSLAPILEKAGKIVQAHFDRSNFTMEIHQAFLDLVVAGTASIAFEEAEPGHYSAYRFSSIPLTDIVLEEGNNGFLDGTFRTLCLTLAQMQSRYPQAELPEHIIHIGIKDAQTQFKVLEAIIPDGNVYLYTARLVEEAGQEDVILAEQKLSQSPIINFRWMKSPGDIYGRSPVMKILPDIKTANKVVELILKNASIAVTGIWQADDDGVLNPANIELVPGAIIPKAFGSKGLTPLEMPGRFDVSQIIIDDLRANIRHALLIDRLPQLNGKRMTATEVLERSNEMALLLGATYGRLQSELLDPLIQRAYAILRRRGEVPDLALDGRIVEIEYRSPLAKSMSQRHVQTTLNWLQGVQSLGPEAVASVDMIRAARYLGEALGVSSDLIRNPETQIETIGEINV
ncbi:MAG: phage tail protein [Micavibrio aeruginosavorus]|uniref:Phage tail protein n=1 Tax=Micavibrio aeruginosavorus TaxID=349221 RepID=A0A2W5FP80_9BACT|nr:MAG: phage tail protein [Micavibrio aeruginosavorus]